MTMRKVNATILMVFVVSAAAAKEPVFNLYPPDYAETCKKYGDLTEKGLTVKAERLAEKYRKEQIYPYFWLKPSEEKRIRLVNQSGWYASSFGGEYHLQQIEAESSDHTGNPHQLSSFIAIKIPSKDLESFQDFLLKWFPVPEPGEPQKFKKHITEVVISITHRDDNSRSVISDCFDPQKRSSQFDVSAGISGEVNLISYKLIERQVIPEKENPSGNSASTDRDLKSEVEQPQESSAKKPDSGSPIINVILGKQPDRYDAVKEILRKEPGQANGVAMSFKWVIYQNGKFQDESESTMYALNAAIKMKDFQMVQLLVENNASMCWNVHPLSGTAYCAVSAAAEFGTPEIHQYLKEQFRKHKQRSGKSVSYGSDIPAAERSKVCMALGDRYGYSEGEAAASQRKATKKICEYAKEFVDLR